MPRAWKLLEQWFADNEDYRPNLMHAKLTETGFEFPSTLPHISLHDLQQEFFAYCDAATATQDSDLDRQTQRDITIRLVTREGCTPCVCRDLYNGLRMAGAPQLCGASNKHAVLLEALSMVLAEDWLAARRDTRDAKHPEI